MGAGSYLGGGMADLQRLIRSALWFAVGVLIAAVPMLASAEDYIAPYANWGLSNSITYIPPDGSSTSDAACLAWSTIYSAAKPELNKGYFRKYAHCYNPNTGAENGTVYSRAYCPYGGTLDSTVFPVICRGAPPCDVGENRNPETGQCEAPPPPECSLNSTINGTGDRCFCNRGYQTPDGGSSYLVAEGGSCESACADAVGITYVFTVANMSGGVCSMGCWYNRESVPGGSNCVASMDISADSSTPTTYRCSMAGTGQHCDGWGQGGESTEPPPPDPEPPTEPPPEPEPEPCKAGFQTVSVNGISSCVKSPPPIDNVDQAQQTTTNPDGTTTTTNKTTTTKVNDDGTVTKTTETQTTTKDQAGNTISSGTSSQSVEQGLEGFCEDNPTSSICGEQPGLFDGSCQGEIKCEGDALQCAIAASTFKTQCALSVTDDVKDAFQDMINYDGTGPGEGLDRLEINVDELQVSMSGGGAGLADQSFSIMGKTIVLPFSQLNSILAFFGYAVMMIAWLQAYKIIREAF